MAMTNNQLPAQQFAPANQRGFLGNIQDFFVGSPDSLQQIPTVNPQQQQLQNLLGGQAGSMLQNAPNNKFNFAPIAQKARTDFQTKTIPSIANRFAGMGNQRGSDYMHALGSAGAGLEEGLAALQSQYDFQGSGRDQQLLMSLLSLALQPRSENVFTPGSNGLLQNLFGIGGGGGDRRDGRAEDRSRQGNGDQNASSGSSGGIMQLLPLLLKLGAAYASGGASLPLI